MTTEITKLGLLIMVIGRDTSMLLIQYRRKLPVFSRRNEKSAGNVHWVVSIRYQKWSVIAITSQRITCSVLQTLHQIVDKMYCKTLFIREAFIFTQIR